MFTTITLVVTSSFALAASHAVYLSHQADLHCRFFPVLSNFFPIVALLADALFATSDRLLAEQQEQFAYLYSYAAMVVESLELVTDRLLGSDRSRVEEAKKEVLEASRICRQVSNDFHVRHN